MPHRENAVKFYCTSAVEYLLGGGGNRVSSGLLHLLDSLAKRPQCYVAHPVSYSTVKSYLNGLAGGLRLAGIEYTCEDYHAAAESRGWDPR